MSDTRDVDVFPTADIPKGSINFGDSAARDDLIVWDSSLEKFNTRAAHNKQIKNRRDRPVLAPQSKAEDELGQELSETRKNDAEIREWCQKITSPFYNKLQVDASTYRKAGIAKDVTREKLEQKKDVSAGFRLINKLRQIVSPVPRFWNHHWIHMEDALLRMPDTFGKYVYDLDWRSIQKTVNHQNGQREKLTTDHIDKLRTYINFDGQSINDLQDDKYFYNRENYGFVDVDCTDDTVSEVALDLGSIDYYMGLGEGVAKIGTFLEERLPQNVYSKEPASSVHRQPNSYINPTIVFEFPKNDRKDFRIRISHLQRSGVDVYNHTDQRREFVYVFDPKSNEFQFYYDDKRLENLSDSQFTKVTQDSISSEQMKQYLEATLELTKGTIEPLSEEKLRELRP
jgi:hypothetical protein